MRTIESVSWIGKCSPIVHIEGPFGFACQTKGCDAYDSAETKSSAFNLGGFHAALNSHEVLAFEVI
jgi:hypothetical protein